VGLRTTRIRLGTGIFNLCPGINHPLRVAEQIATIDILTDGRVDLGTGRGSSSTEVNGFGISPDESRAMWEEAIRAIPKMWTQDLFSWDGTYFSVPERCVLPKPVQQPHPPLWVTASNPATVEIGGRLGLGVAVFSYGPAETLRPIVERYKEAVARATPVGDVVNDRILAVSKVLCLEDSEQARTQHARNAAGTAPYFMTYLDSVPANAARHADAARPVPQSVLRGWVDDEIRAAAGAGGLRVPSADELHHAGICVGSPDEIAETVETYRRAGVVLLVFTPRAGFEEPFALTTLSLRLLGREVLPKFR
jgi:alkanesulfonate monooxygenase SsuD/methylene tetrahydromethanopterin reductase-like flavin-dependent oxidoreductase (luciferase family)